MPIVSTDIKFKLSGGTSNTSPAASLGGARSTAGGGDITPGSANNVWDDVNASEASAGDVEYRGLYVLNNHGSLTLQSARLWIDSLTSSADTEFDIGLDGTVGSTAVTVANESTAPSGVTFSRPTSKGTGLSIGDMAAGTAQPFWEKRTVSASASAASDTGSVRVEGDTAP